MRQAIKVKWFKECSSIEQARRLYLQLAKQHHPDRGGELSVMQEINAEYDYIKDNPSALHAHSDSDDASWENAWEYVHKDYSARTNNRASYRAWSSYDWQAFNLTPGRYTVKIISVKDNEFKSYVALIFDIAEGSHRGYFSHDPWHKHCIYLKYEEEWQRKETARVIRIINNSNTGFDGFNCMSNGDVLGFIGKKFGVKLTQEYIDGKGFIKTKDVFEI